MAEDKAVEKAEDSITERSLAGLGKLRPSADNSSQDATDINNNQSTNTAKK